MRPSEDSVDGIVLLRTIVDSAAEHIHVKDLEGRYLLINRADAQWCGYEPDDMLGRTDADLIDPLEAAEAMARDHEVIESGRPVVFEQEATRNGVTRIWLTTKNVVRDGDGHIGGMFTISHEITDQRRHEEQLRQTAKMEAVGQLAGGIAHDLNNILTAVRGYAELVREALPETQEQARVDLEQVVLAADRAAELTHQLLAFSRRQVLAPPVLEPSEIVGGIAPVLRRLLGEHIELTVRNDPDVGRTRVDPT